MHVVFYKPGPGPDPQRIGVITQDAEGVLVCDPPGDPLLQSALAERFVAPQEDGRPGWVNAATPRAFLRGLPYRFKSPYLWAEIEEGGSGSKALPESGYTGEKEDKIGRRMCFQEGIHVPCDTDVP